MGIEWLKIKNEYINTDISQRKLADKYSVSFNTLKSKANKEKWADEKEKQHNKITTKIQQKTTERIVNQEVGRLTKINNVADVLLSKIEEATEQLNNISVTNKTKIKTVEYGNKKRPDKATKEIIKEVENINYIVGDIDRAGLKMVVGALKDLKEIVKDDVNTKDLSININIDDNLKDISE